MNTTNVDVLISGAGVGGTFLALLLGKAGLTVMVTDPNSRPAAKGADFLKPRGIRALDRHGVLQPLLRDGAMRRHEIHYYHDGTELQKFDFTEHTKLGYYLIVPYHRIVDSIIRECTPHSGIMFRFNTAVDSLHEAGNGIHSALLDIGESIQARVFVAADGSSTSPIRAYVGQGLDTCTFDHTLHTATLNIAQRSDDTNRLYFSSNGAFAYIYPIAPTTARIFVGTPSAHTRMLFGPGQSEPLSAYLASFVTESARHLAQVDGATFRTIPINASLAPSHVKSNATLLGSAAFSCHPMTGQGMSYTLEDAEVLANAIVSAVYTNTSPHELLRTLYAPRRTLHQDLIEYGNALATTYHDRTLYRRTFQPARHGGDLVIPQRPISAIAARQLRHVSETP